jgi:hypothetical protein
MCSNSSLIAGTYIWSSFRNLTIHQSEPLPHPYPDLRVLPFSKLERFSAQKPELILLVDNTSLILTGGGDIVKMMLNISVNSCLGLRGTVLVEGGGVGLMDWQRSAKVEFL